MNRSLGTTIILTSPSDIYLKYFASVLIFLDHGHISKIRTGNSRSIRRENSYKKIVPIKIKETIKKEDIINLIAHFLIQYLLKFFI